MAVEGIDLYGLPQNRVSSTKKGIVNLCVDMQ